MSKASSTGKNAGKLNLSAGILVFRKTPAGPEVLLGHPGGPIWQKKDAGSWTIPKGELGTGELPQDAARREFSEETGWDPGPLLFGLGAVKQKAGKQIFAWCAEGYKPADQLHSNLFEMEWPPKSGRVARFPEIDRFGWFPFTEAREKINQAQRTFIDELEKKLAAG